MINSFLNKLKLRFDTGTFYYNGHLEYSVMKGWGLVKRMLWY